MLTIGSSNVGVTTGQLQDQSRLCTPSPEIQSLFGAAPSEIGHW
jgi:hypothetical protein